MSDQDQRRPYQPERYERGSQVPAPNAQPLKAQSQPPAPPPPAAANRGTHVFRSWEAPEPEHLHHCDCPRTPCGGTYFNDWWNSDCPQHHNSKTVRSGHDEAHCPGAGPVVTYKGSLPVPDGLVDAMSDALAMLGDHCVERVEVGGMVTCRCRLTLSQRAHSAHRAAVVLAALDDDTRVTVSER